VSLHTLKTEHFVSRKRPEVFEFFSCPENLALLTPGSMDFRILTPLPVSMHEGTLIDYTIRVAGLPIRWTTLITVFQPPLSFVDVQLRGPYSFWHHTHSFHEHHGGTLMIDEVRYQLPFGPLGDIAYAIAVRKKLDSIFQYRSRMVDKLLGTNPDPPSASAPLSGTKIP
jgi:ligand-binding SRPBCC domain-containing protein